MRGSPRRARGSHVEELGGEKIDIIKYSETPNIYRPALSPAEVESWIPGEGRSCRVVCRQPLSLAIARRGRRPSGRQAHRYKNDINRKRRGVIPARGKSPYRRPAFAKEHTASAVHGLPGTKTEK